MNYFDILLAKKLEDDRDPKVEGLSVTENGRYHEDGVVYDPVIVNVPETPLSKLTVTQNGTYTAPTGTGYNEVDVDVPLPSNAYLLKEIEDVEIASFNDGSDLPMPKLEVGIEPVQDLHGYDAPWVGGAGKNKFDATTLMANVNSSVQYVTITLKPNTTYTMSTSLGKVDNVCNLFFMLPNESASSASNGVYSGLSISVTSGNDGQVKIGYRLPSDSTTSAQYLAKQYQIEEGSTATTFAPYSNICPISGWDEVNVGVSGVNVWDEEWEKGAFNTTTGENINSGQALQQIRTKNPIPVKGGTPLYFHTATDLPLNSDGAWTMFFDKDMNIINSNLPSGRASSGNCRLYNTQVITIPSNACYIRFYMTNTYGTTYNNDISINYPSTDTSYHAYNGHTITLDLDGTRYGGKVDLVSGVMTVDRVRVSGLNWYGQSSETQKSYYSDVINNIKIPTSTYTTVGAMSSDYIEGSSSNFVSSGDGKFCISQGRRININDNRYQSLADFKVAIPNIDIVYELATPLTIQLPTTVVKSLSGMNNVFADTGNILDLSYLAKEE